MAARIRLVCFLAFGMLFHSCRDKHVAPVNTGREYGNPKLPWMVSHLPEANQWALARAGHHNVFQKVLCFDLKCRKMIGRRKALHSISFKDYRKRIRKNARKGLYETKGGLTVPARTADTTARPQKILKVDTTVTIASQPLATEKPGLPTIQADSLITLRDVLFEVNSFHLERGQLGELNRLAEYLSLRPAIRISISGHTDNTGSERHNISLSLRRAESVAEYLIDQGLESDRIFYEGFGSSKPIADNKTPQGRSQNRRVEILLKRPN